MSNRNDFDFDDDFFGDSDRDSRSAFDFGEEAELPPIEFGAGEELPPMEDQPEPGGTSRAFVILAILMMLTFIGGLALAVFLITQPQGPSVEAITATYVSEFNATQIAFLGATQTQARSNELGTLTAIAFTDTPSPTLTPSNTPTHTPEPSATLSPTIDPVLLTATDVISAFAATSTAVAMMSLTPDVGAPTEEPKDETPTGDIIATRTPTPISLIQTPVEATLTPTPDGGAIGSLNRTATAIVGQFQTATAQAGGSSVITEATPTSEGGGGDIATPTPGGFVGLIPTPEVLPDTGLFDGVVSGGAAAIPALAMMIVGLVGVIFAARKLRTGGKRPTHKP